MALIILGSIISIVGWIWLLIACFKESILWGVGGLLCGIVALVYGIMNFAELKIPVMLYIGGAIISVIGQVMKGG